MWNDLSFQILSLGVDRQIDLCAPNGFGGIDCLVFNRLFRYPAAAECGVN